MTTQSHIAGAILAGGGARRMFPDAPGGGDKSLADLAGRPLLAHVIERFRPQVARLILNANGDPSRFAPFELEVVADAMPDCGPLAGLLAAIDWAERADARFTAIATVSTDTPFLPHDLVQMLEARRGEGIAIAASNGRLHPVIGVWPLALRASVEKALAEGRRSVEKFAADHAAVAVPFPFGTIRGRNVDPFFNANTRDDLKAAHDLLRGDNDQRGRP